jgi:hypothetical protein
MLNIQQSNTWKKDIAQYKRDIEKINSNSAKENCYEILNKLSREYNYIDAVHNVSNKSIDPTKIRENVENGISLRNELNRIIKDSKDL